MKKLFTLILSACFLPLALNAQMRWNTATNAVYSYPESSKINKCEYFVLLLACAGIAENMKSMNWSVSSKAVIEQCIYYLKKIGKPVALRLADDIKNNAYYYANGSYAGKLFNY